MLSAGLILTVPHVLRRRVPPVGPVCCRQAKDAGPLWEQIDAEAGIVCRERTIIGCPDPG